MKKKVDTARHARYIKIQILELIQRGGGTGPIKPQQQILKDTVLIPADTRV